MAGIPDFVGGKKPLKANRSSRLAAAGINEELFNLYEDLFVHHRSKYPFGKGYVNDTKTHWKTIHYQPTDREVLMHLTQEIALSLPFSSQTNMIAIDIDCKDQTLFNGSNQQHPAFERFERIKSALGGHDALVFQSSPSRGWHMYLFLDELYDTRLVSAHVAQQLSRASISIRPGYVENPLSSQRTLFRMPLGEGSWIIDPSDGSHVVDDLADSLIYLKENLHQYTYPLACLTAASGSNGDSIVIPISTKLKDRTIASGGNDSDQQQACRYPNRDSQRAATVGHNEHRQYANAEQRGPKPALPNTSTNNASKKQHPSRRAEMLEVARKAVIDGLSAEGTRQYVTKCMVTYAFLEKRLDEASAFEFVWSWLSSKHNGKSADWNAGSASRKKIRKEIGKLIESWVNHGEQEMPREQLTKREIASLVLKTKKSSEAEWISEFFHCVKKHVRMNPEGGLALGHTWFKRVWNCSIGTATSRVKHLQELGILIMQRDYLRRKYVRLWKVNKVTTEPGEYDSFVEGLFDIFGSVKVKEMYGKSQYRRLKQKHQASKVSVAKTRCVDRAA